MPSAALLKKNMADSKISYDDAVRYWSSVSTDDNGVLGGFGNSVIPKVDIAGSLSFVRRLKELSPTTFPNYTGDFTRRALDVGAGIGRVTMNVLSRFVDHVDIVEPAEPLLRKAVETLKDQPYECSFFSVGLQDFLFPNSYWIVWCQWCLGQVPDDALVEFFMKASQKLVQGGLIIVKENQSTSDDDIFDEQDSSVTRTDTKFRHIFERAGLRLLLTSTQKGMPKGLFPVRMYALAPREYATL